MNLTIVVPNRNRFNFNQPSSQWFLNSLQWQDNLEFELLVVDGGSENFDEIKSYLESNTKFKTTVFQHKIGEVFHKTLLNNVAIRKSNTEYVACTDADIVFDRKFTNTVIPLLNPNIMIESRTMYWREWCVEKIYKGELDPYEDINSCKNGRIKKRTTPGGFQCLHRDNWNKISGYNEEEIIGWGSEDVELLERAQMAGIKVQWLGEGFDDIMLFHQPHPKNTIEDLKCQEKNKKVLENIRNFKANPNGWGGVKLAIHNYTS